LLTRRAVRPKPYFQARAAFFYGLKEFTVRSSFLLRHIAFMRPPLSRDVDV
jgi:hypothetical protein